jgi:hypothetical protein
VRSILIKETPEAGSFVDEFERRASTNQADNEAESDEAGIIALRHKMALILAKQVLSSHCG